MVAGLLRRIVGATRPDRSATRPVAPAELNRAALELARFDVADLERKVPVACTLEERIALATRCRDGDVLPRVAGAGRVIERHDGTRVQIMHNGIQVVVGGYCGEWMQDLIARCGGVHEPQEECAFAEALRHLRATAAMIELGGYWSFYSIWFLSGSKRRRSVVVEADPAHLEVGRANARLNGCAPTFVWAHAAATPRPTALFQTESSGQVEIEGVSVPQLMALHRIETLDVLHCDAQGVEFSILDGCRDVLRDGRIRWVFVSTHTHHISGDPLTHQRCLALLQGFGGTIVAEHDVQESFSGDGLIVALFGPLPREWRPVALSRNRYSESLFRNPLYDLAAATRSLA